jgi:hypothetical protein
VSRRAVRALACCLVVFTVNQLMLTEELQKSNDHLAAVLNAQRTAAVDTGFGGNRSVMAWIGAQLEAEEEQGNGEKGGGEVEGGGADGEKGGEKEAGGAS